MVMLKGSERKSLDGPKASRRYGEKIRRDRLNNYIAQLAEEVPGIAEGQKRADKVTILRRTVAYLKLQYGMKRRSMPPQWQSMILSHDALCRLIVQAAGGFSFVLSQDGSVLFVSSEIEKVLGLSQVDVIGNRFFDWIHPDDCKVIEELFCATDRHVSLSKTSMLNIGVSRPHSSNVSLRHQFHVRMQTMDTSDSTGQPVYTWIKVIAHLLSADIGTQTDKRCAVGASLTEDWLVGVGCVASQPSLNDLQLSLPNFLDTNSYHTKHSMDSRILYVEPKVSLITGFLPHELVGNLPLDFIVKDDLQSIVVSHTQIFEDNEIPSTVFRMKTKQDGFVYIQSHSVIVFDQWTKEPKYIFSINTVLSEGEGMVKLEDQKQKTNLMIEAMDKLKIAASETTDVQSCSLTDTTCGIESSLDKGFEESMCSNTSQDDISMDASPLHQSLSPFSTIYQSLSSISPDNSHCSSDQGQLFSPLAEQSQPVLEGQSLSSVSQDNFHCFSDQGQLFSPAAELSEPVLEGQPCTEYFLPPMNSSTGPESSKLLKAKSMPILKSLLLNSAGNEEETEKTDCVCGCQKATKLAVATPQSSSITVTDNGLPNIELAAHHISCASTSSCATNVFSLCAIQKQGEVVESSLSSPNRHGDKSESSQTEYTSVMSHQPQAVQPDHSLVMNHQSQVDLPGSSVTSKFTCQLQHQHSSLHHRILQQHFSIGQVKTDLQKCSPAVLNSDNSSLLHLLKERADNLSEEVCNQEILLKDLEDQLSHTTTQIIPHHQRHY